MTNFYRTASRTAKLLRKLSIDSQCLVADDMVVVLAAHKGTLGFDPEDFLCHNLTVQDASAWVEHGYHVEGKLINQPLPDGTRQQLVLNASVGSMRQVRRLIDDWIELVSVAEQYPDLDLTMVATGSDAWSSIAARTPLGTD